MYNYIIKKYSLLQYLSRPMLFIARCSFIPGYLLKKIKKIWLLWPGAPVAISEAGHFVLRSWTSDPSKWLEGSLNANQQGWGFEPRSALRGQWRMEASPWDCRQMERIYPSRWLLMTGKTLFKSTSICQCQRNDTIIRPSLIHQLLFGTWTILNKSLDGHLPIK